VARRWRAAAVAAVAAALLAVVATAIVPGRATHVSRPAPAGALPVPVTPAFVPGPARALGSTRHLAHWAPVQRRAVVRRVPGEGAAAVTALDTSTPEGTRNIVAVLGHHLDRRGRVWAHVRPAMLPNGATGWVPRSALGGYGTVRTLLVVDTERLEAVLLSDGRPELRVPVGVGMPGWRTPRGRFYIRNRLTRYRSPEYGPVAFGTSARSPTATDWPAGGYVGIHGTDRPDLIPGRVSHGCIRMRNGDILALARRMPVGTPVVIR
jgi:lipoprotein-anchoring transpeptidase ErfK/SrfK